MSVIQLEFWFNGAPLARLTADCEFSFWYSGTPLLGMASGVTSVARRRAFIF